MAGGLCSNCVTSLRRLIVAMFGRRRPIRKQPSDLVECAARATKTRRQLLTALPFTIGAAAIPSNKAMAQRHGAYRAYSPSEINIISMGADPTGNADSSRAILASALALPATGGSLLIPAGIYRCESQIDLPAKPIAIIGEGSNASILVIYHSGIALNFQQQTTAFNFFLSGIGFTPIGSGNTRPQSAIYVALPNDDPVENNPSCTIRDVDLAVFLVRGRAFFNGVTLMNVWRTLLSNVSHAGPGAGVIGSTFVTLGGFSIDNRFENCICEGVDVAYLTSSYTEGIHLISPVLAGCNNAVVIGPRVPPFQSNNALAIYISGGELNCYSTALDLNQMWGGWISDTHIASSNAGPVILLSGCVMLQFINCSISGDGYSTVGFLLETTAGAGCAGNMIDSCLFSSINTPIIFSNGAVANTAQNVRSIASNTFPLLSPDGIVVDNSGNETNNVSWLTGKPGANRVEYLY
jgi:hypothetical protein